MTERRRFARVNRKLAVRFKVFDRDTKIDITDLIDAYTENISKGGMRLILPRAWDCPECSNCLGWMYNLDCKLRNSHTKETERFLNPKLNLKILLTDSSDTSKEPIQLEGECVWVNPHIDSSKKDYPVGVSLSKIDHDRISSYLPSILS